MKDLIYQPLQDLVSENIVLRDFIEKQKNDIEKTISDNLSEADWYHRQGAIKLLNLLLRK